MKDPQPRGPGVFDLQLGSEDGNSRTSGPDSQTSAADAIAVFAPWSGPADRPLRLRLHRAQAAAEAKANRCEHGNARAIYWLAAQMAGARIYARLTVDELGDAIDNVSRLLLVAGYVERTEMRDA